LTSLDRGWHVNTSRAILFSLGNGKSEKIQWLRTSIHASGGVSQSRLPHCPEGVPHHRTRVHNNGIAHDAWRRTFMQLCFKTRATTNGPGIKARSGPLKRKAMPKRTTMTRAEGV
jgi:hypothetical protein